MIHATRDRFHPLWLLYQTTYILFTPWGSGTGEGEVEGVGLSGG